jgi:hypothetical protein
MVIHLLLFALAFKKKKKKKPNYRSGLRGFVQNSCAQERCEHIDICLHMICYLSWQMIHYNQYLTMLKPKSGYQIIDENVKRF